METLKLEVENSKDIPILIAPGWSETCTTLKPLAQQLQQKLNRTIITLTHPRKEAKLSAHSKYLEEEWRKANNLKNLLEQEGIKEVDVVAHSEGGINSVIAATEFPEFFRQLVLITPAGLIGQDSLPSLSARFIEELANARILNTPKNPPVENFAYFGKESFRYVKNNPIRAWNEVTEIAKIQTPEMIQELIKNNINVSLIYADDDRIFPASQINQAIQGIPFKKKLHTKGQHFDLCLFPQNYVPLIQECLE